MVLTYTQDHDDRFSSKWVNLAEERLGTRVLYATDDFFAEKENLIKPGRGIFIADKYTENGKWMDGWESRRKRTPGHDWCVIALGLSGVIRGFDIDTNHFTGNHPAQASVEACCLDEGDPDEHTQWTEILPPQDLNPGSQHLFEVNSDQRWTHVKLHIYPDGGVARLRVYGDVQCHWDAYEPEQVIDLIAVENEGKALLCSDMYFSNMSNLIAPGRGVNMGDGWETKRRRGPGFDWVILKLGRPGCIQKVELDTAYFKGNYPDRFSLEVTTDANIGDGSSDQIQWSCLIPETKLSADKVHLFDGFDALAGVTAVRLNIFPDGGVSRLRLWGVRS